MRVLFMLIAYVFLAVSLEAAHFTLRGTVTDSRSKERIAAATIRLTPVGKVVQTDAQGNFLLLLPQGRYKVQVSFVGYATHSQTIDMNCDRQLNVQLSENSRMLGEVVITAKESSGMTSASRIGRDAMTHLQPTSFTDLLELLPGNMSQTPNMGAVNSIALRETGTLGATGAKVNNPDYNISALGTLFVVDGAPVVEDANLQNVPNGSTIGSPEYKRDATNKGVDMRTLSTDNIESVEIVRGIPSVEYGNLTSGLVNIRRIRRATPLTARFKADEYSKLVSVGKGFYLGGSEHIMNVDGGFLDSKTDPRNNLENYKRLNLSSRLNFQWKREALLTGWVVGIDYTGSFDNAKTDPDISISKLDEYKSSYNRVAFTSDLNMRPKHLKWLNLLNFNSSVSTQRNRLERRKIVAPQRASVAPTTMEEGVHDGQYLLGEYVAHYVSDGKPTTLFLKLKGEGECSWAGIKNSYKLGGEYNFTKNYGDGQVYDLLKPLSASWTTRPRAYKDIPALQTLSWYAENMLTAHLGHSKLQVQLGLRTIQLLGLNSAYDLAGRVFLDPRVNGKFTFPTFTVAGQPVVLFVATGYGVTTKMPTTDYLFPQVHYSDFIQLNYYDVNKPNEYSRVNLRTYIEDATNYRLKPAVNLKWELRWGGSWGQNHFSITYFNEKMTSGYRYSTLYRPYAYRKYDLKAIDPSVLTGPPSLDNLPFLDKNILDGYSQVTNGSRLDKQGIEFVVNTARFKPLATALTVTGAWFRSTYTNSQMLFDPVSDVVNNVAVSDKYVGYYDCNNGRVNDRFNTNFMFDTQITRWGLIFSTSVQCMWFTSTKKMWQNGIPDYYLDVADGQLHPYTPAMRHDPELQFLTRTYNEAVYRKQTTPVAAFVNIKATKQVGKLLNIAVFANQMLDYLPSYHSNGLLVRRSSNPYFGMELNLKI